jgi:DNA-binding LacI/PurR family transcriptional regulator
MGFDNIHILEFMFPLLSTVSNAVDRVAVTAVDTLVKRMNGEKLDNQIILKHQILTGSTI